MVEGEITFRGPFEKFSIGHRHKPPFHSRDVRRFGASRLPRSQVVEISDVVIPVALAVVRNLLLCAR